MEKRDWQQFSVGVRIVVRTRLPEGAPKRFTDVIGIVLRNDEVSVQLQRDAAAYDRGDVSSIVTINWADVEIANRVPPRPTRRVSEMLTQV